MAADCRCATGFATVEEHGRLVFQRSHRWVESQFSDKHLEWDLYRCDHCARYWVVDQDDGISEGAEDSLPP